MILRRFVISPPRPALRSVLLAALLAAGAAGALAADAKASKFYEDALERYEKRDLQGAIIQLKNALRADKALLPVHVLLGKALLASGEVSAAEAAFNEALRLGVNRAEIVLLLSRAVLAQGKLQEVVSAQVFQLAGLPAGVQARLLLVKAGAHSDLGDPRQALKSIEEARTVDPGLIDTWLAEVPARIRARQFKEALAAVEKARAMNPNSAEMHYQFGTIQHLVGDRAVALAAYDKALAADSGHTEARVSRAGLYFDLKRNADAAKDVAELLAKTPLEPRGWYLSALLAEREGKEQAVKTALAKITALLDPVPPQFIRFRPQMLLLNGQAHFALGEREKAKPFLEAFQRVQPASPVSKLLARIQLAEGNHDRAIDSLDQYLRAFPNDSQALALLASAHMAKGRHARAASLMQEALRHKDEAELYTAYGLSLMGTGQAASAVTQLETAYKKDPGQTQAAYALVGLYLRHNQAPKALVVANALVRGAPANPSFQNLLGLSKSALRDTAGARAAFEQAMKLDPTLLQASLNLARLEAGANQVDRAQALLDGVLKADERNTEAIYEQAVLAERRGDADAALRLLMKGQDIGGAADLRPGLALVDLHLRHGRRPEALKTALQVSGNAPENLQVLLALARAQLANADYTNTRNTLNTATRIAQFVAPVQVEVALLQLAARNLAGAGYSVDKALADKPDFVPALALKTELEIRQGEFAKAEQRAQLIVKREPKLPVGYSLLGDLALARKQPTAAIEAYRKAHQVQPTLDTLARLARVLSMQDPKAGIQLLEQWVKTKATDAAARSMLAEAYVRSNNLPAARQEYERLREQRPADAGVLNNLANVLLRLKDPQALAVAEQALAANPNSAVMIDTAGWVAFQSGKLDRALQLLRDARLRNPENGEIRFHLASALAAGGRKAEARSELEAALGGGADFEGRSEAVALLGTLK
jgi:putative PEP-CTERM system TPR-repeat lipoprotein